jgi:hypothetical protein
MKPVGKPDAVIPHVRFDERRLETELRRELRHRHRRKQSETVQPRSLRPPRQSSTLLGDEFAPGVTSGVDDVVVGFEDEV